MIRWIDSDIEQLFNNAVNCNYCFAHKYAKEATGNIPQPRWIGPNYKKSLPRILISLLNPGSGKGYACYTNNKYDPLTDYKAGTKNIEEYLLFQRDDMSNWGHGKFICYYKDLLGMDFNNIAFANIAWCATEGNSYPRNMLLTCFKKYTERLMSLLSPNIVILSGQQAWLFEQDILSINRDIKVIKSWHYANRKSAKDVQSHILHVKQHIVAIS